MGLSNIHFCPLENLSPFSFFATKNFVLYLIDKPLFLKTEYREESLTQTLKNKPDALHRV